MRSIRRSGNEYAVEGYPHGKFFIEADEAMALCEGHCGRFYVDGNSSIPYQSERSPSYVLLTPEVLKCLKDGGFFKQREA